MTAQQLKKKKNVTTLLHKCVSFGLKNQQLFSFFSGVSTVCCLNGAVSLLRNHLGKQANDKI